MTLVLMLANQASVIQISDSRLTSQDAITSEETGKAGVLSCLDARLVFAFSGLAQAGSFNTQAWILEALVRCGKPDYCVRPLLERLRTRLTHKFSSLPLRIIAPERRRLSIMFSGFYYGMGEAHIVNAILTNFQKFETGRDSPVAWDYFDGLYLIGDVPVPGEPTFMQRIGQWPLLPEVFLEPFRIMLERRASPRAITARAVALFRELADFPQAHRSIGKQITTIILPPDRSRPAESEYHSAKNSSRLYLPDYVVVQPGLEAAMADSHLCLHDVDGKPGVIVTPKAHRGHPCPCGSRKRYGECHGRVGRARTRRGKPK
jgi:hypothetical protein